MLAHFYEFLSLLVYATQYNENNDVQSCLISLALLRWAYAKQASTLVNLLTVIPTEINLSSALLTLNNLSLTKECYGNFTEANTNSNLEQFELCTRAQMESH